MLPKFDDDQLKAVHSLKNTVVTAGAGSGKTSVLAARFLWLLKTQKVAVDEILTLTFTNKAAAEMRERILQALEQEPDPALVRERGNFHQAQISTIDSFCAQIVRNSASLFGLAEDFTIDEEALEKLTSGLSLDFGLRYPDRPGVRALVKRFRFHGLTEDFLGRIARDYLSLADEVDFTALLDRQYQALAAVIPGHCRAFMEAASSLMEDFPKPFKTVTDNKSVLARAAEVGELTAAGRFTEAGEILAALKLQKPGGKATESIQLLKSLIDTTRHHQEKLLAVIAAFEEREIVRDLFDLLSSFQDELDARKRAQKLVSFHDVARLAVKALLVNTPLRRYYKSRYRFIMIDEFQDNNHLQKELLSLLAERRDLLLDRVPGPAELEPDKLFFVGDEKQSIYGFRGAEVDVFKALKDELQAHGGEAIPFRNNYRSKPGLIAFFNRVFSGVMAASFFPFEAEFEKLEARLPTGATRPSVRLFYKAAESDEPEENGFSAAESEAYSVGSFLKRSVENGTLFVDEDGRPRPVRYGDIAVLMRSTGNQITFERMFRHLGVPYVTHNIRSLFLEPPVNDIYALFQCALHPEDRLAYATLLRSPFVRVSDAGLLSALETEEAPFTPTTLSPRDAARYAKGGERYRFIRERIDREPVTMLAFHAWYTLGYRYFIMQQPAYAMYLEYYDYFYSLAVKSEARGESMEQFLSWVRSNLGLYEKLEELEDHGRDGEGVRIMTIHKAKGLEFPVLVLADMGNAGRKHGSASPVYFTREFGPVVNLSGKSELASVSRQEEEDREHAEIKRLFYVALTRAESHLILSGVHHRQNLSREKAHLTMLFHALELSEDNFDGLFSDEYDAEVIPIADLTEQELFHGPSRTKKTGIEAVVTLYKTAGTPERNWQRNRFSVSELNTLYASRCLSEKKSETVTFPALHTDRYLTTDEARAQWGSLVHEVVSRKIMDAYSPDSLPLSLQSGFDRSVYPELLKEAERLADRFLGSEWGRLAAAAEEKESEFHFLLRFARRNGEFFIHGTVDLFFTTKDRAFVIDFKTDRSLNRHEYAAQLCIYREAIAAYSGKPTTALLYSLRTGELITPETGISPDDLLALLEIPC